MARPSASIIISTQLNDQLGIDILQAPGQWIVLYKEQPVNIRQRYWDIKGELPKYMRTSFPNANPAQRLAAKLNAAFFTEDFTVKKII